MIHIRKTILTLIGIMFFSSVFAQKADYELPPKANERVIGNVIESVRDYGGENSLNKLAYPILLEKAKKEFPNKLIDLRNVETAFKYMSNGYNLYSGSAKVVEVISPETQLNETLLKALDKAISNVREGSRMAIDQISASGGLDKTTVKDQLIDILLDRGYKVVAKEYLEKLKEEQEEQMSGGYNEKKTAKTDNLSGAGYFLNIRVNEKSIRIQVVNVSTGEYEGNATVDF
jgi:hypothetical protein